MERATLDQQNLPAFNGSFEENIFITFDTLPLVGERYFLPQNSLLDAAIITGVRPHYNVVDYDMSPTFQIGDTNYNVIPRLTFRNILLSLATKRNSIKIQRLPLSTLEVLPGTTGLNNRSNPKARKAFYIAVSSRQCFIEFTDTSALVLPFVVPISFNYTLRKI